MNVSTSGGFVNKTKAFATFPFRTPFSARKHACGPETRALRGKSIGGKRIPPGDPAGLPHNGAGPAGARPGAPTAESTRSFGKNGLPALYHARQGPARSKKRGAPHGFFAQRPCFRAGHGLKFNRPYIYLAKSPGGQKPLFFFLTVHSRRANKMEEWGREAASLIVHFLKECCHAGPILGKRN